MGELGKAFGPDATEEFIAASIQVYRNGTIVWVVDERDLVYIQTQKGPKPTGYNHSRAWRGAMTRYSPYTNPGDVEFWSQAECDRIEEIVANRKLLSEPPLLIED